MNILKKIEFNKKIKQTFLSSRFFENFWSKLFIAWFNYIVLHLKCYNNNYLLKNKNFNKIEILIYFYIKLINPSYDLLKILTGFLAKYS